MDTYCGIGTMRSCEQECETGYWGRTNKDAVKDAKLNKTFNKVENIKFIQGDE